MKSRAQIEAYLKSTRPKREIDELAIRHYCLNSGIDLTGLNNSTKTPNKPSISYRQFKKWIGDNNLKKGDIIKLESDGNIGLVRSSDTNTITFHALLNVSSGELRTSDITFDRTAYQTASSCERKLLQRALSSKNLSYLLRKNTLVEKFRPLDGSFVRVSILDQKVGMGIFHEINKEGKILFHVFLNNTSRYYLNKTYRFFSDCQLSLIKNSKDIESINNTLKQSGYVWDGYSKKVGINGLRRFKGGVYYYINNYLEIITATDEYSKLDLKRFRAKNYYIQREDAVDMLSVFSDRLPKEKRKLGQVYYYIDNYLEIVEVADYRKSKDTKRFEAGNYFLDKKAAQLCLGRYFEMQEIKLQKIPSSLLEPKPKKGRKPKNQDKE